MSDLRIAIIVGSTRPGRKGQVVAQWVLDRTRGRGAEYEVVDLADHPLPLYDEPHSPSRHDYQHAHTREWAETIAPYDGFIFVTPEYNHSTSAVLKNALDYLGSEWNSKAAAIVSYGTTGGQRAAEHLRQILGELQVADVQRHVALEFIADFEGGTELRPTPRNEKILEALFGQLEAWAGALQAVRRVAVRA